MKYGYSFNTKDLFSFDKSNFKYLGKKDYREIGIKEKHDGSVFFDNETDELQSVDENYAFILGAYYLSGATSGRSVVIFSDGATTVSFVVVDNKKEINIIPFNIKNFNDSNESIVVCGNVCNIPSQVTNIANEFKFNPIYFCPIIDELAAFGALFVGMRKKLYMPPKRVQFWERNTKEIEGVPEFMEFDENLQDYNEPYGKLAYAVCKHGRKSLNQIKKGIGISPFYDKVISTEILSDEPLFIVNYKNMEKYFPDEYISTRGFAATSVPVMLKNTDDFKRDSKYDGSEVKIFAVVSEYSDALVFFNFGYSMSGSEIVSSYNPSSLKMEKINLVYRYNKSYRVTKERYKNGIN
jgi:hypothetical protein